MTQTHPIGLAEPGHPEQEQERSRGTLMHHSDPKRWRPGHVADGFADRPSLLMAEEAVCSR